MLPFDCHTHIYDDSFSADFGQMLARARKVLSGIIVVSEGPESNRKVLALCKKHSGFLFPGLAIHPDKVHTLTDAQIDEEINFIRKQKKLVCIGECGLDYLWAQKSGAFEDTKRRQQETFRKFIALADKMNLPLNIHSRRADSVVVKILKELRPKKAVLHGFSGSLAEAKEIVSLGYKIVIGTNLFFSKETQSYVECLPLETFILETDSPVQAPRNLGDRRSPRGNQRKSQSDFLGQEKLTEFFSGQGDDKTQGVLQHHKSFAFVGERPPEGGGVPCGSERNEPANVALVVKEIARLRRITEADIIEITNKNVKEVFAF